MKETTPIIHFVAVVTDKGANSTGKILYVNPSSVQSHSAAKADTATGHFCLILRDKAGQELARHFPAMRYSACEDNDETPIQALIQEDVTNIVGLASIDLMHQEFLLDTFIAEQPVPTTDIAAGLALHGPTPESKSKQEFGAKNIAHRPGTSYVIQARPDTGTAWHTLAVGRPTPEFTIDKNQFPAASSVDIRIIQNAGFNRYIVDERQVSLEDG